LDLGQGVLGPGVVLEGVDQGDPGQPPDQGPVGAGAGLGQDLGAFAGPPVQVREPGGVDGGDLAGRGRGALVVADLAQERLDPLDGRGDLGRAGLQGPGAVEGVQVRTGPGTPPSCSVC